MKKNMKRLCVVVAMCLLLTTDTNVGGDYNLDGDLVEEGSSQ